MREIKDFIPPKLWPFLLLLLSGCGFHLKGYQQAASPVLEGLYVVGGEQRDSLAGSLDLNLRTGGVKLAADEETARARVETCWPASKSAWLVCWYAGVGAAHSGAASSSSGRASRCRVRTR